METVKRYDFKLVGVTLSLVSMLTVTAILPFALCIFGIKYAAAFGIAQFIFDNFWWISLSADIVSIICMCTGAAFGIACVIKALIKGTLKFAIRKGWKVFLAAVWQ